MKIPSTELAFDVSTVSGILATLLQRDEAECRAKTLVEGFNQIGCPLKLHSLKIGKSKPWPYYTFGKSAFGENSLNGAPSPALKAVGFGLNWGDLLTLSKVTNLAQSLWGRDWAKRFRKRIQNFDDHIAFVEELWWLSFWHHPQNLLMESSPFPPCKKGVDWQFETCGITINLEVKYRPRDWIRQIDDELYSNVVTSSYFDDISEKFPKENPGQINLVAMTIIGPINHDFQVKSRQFLDKTPTISGVIIWSIGHRNTLAPQFHLRSDAKFVKDLFKPADDEDRWRNPFILHPWKDREKRRARRLGVIEDFGKIDGAFTKVGRIFVPKQGDV